MRLARVTAIIVLVQGVTPVLTLGVLRSGGMYLAGAACAYAVLAYGLWASEQWALPLGFSLTLPQLLIVNTWLVSWRFFVGLSLGMGIHLQFDVLNAQTFICYQYGAGSAWSFFGYNSAILSTAGHGTPTPFAFLNVIAAGVLGLLVRLRRKLSCSDPVGRPT